MRENLEELIKANIGFLSSKSSEEWIELLKSIAISTLPFYGSDSEIEAIKDIKCVSIYYERCGLVKIELMTDTLAYEDFRIELSTTCIKISRQRSHTEFEEYCSIPIEAFRILCK